MGTLEASRVAMADQGTQVAMWSGDSGGHDGSGDSGSHDGSGDSGGHGRAGSSGGHGGAVLVAVASALAPASTTGAL